MRALARSATQGHVVEGRRGFHVDRAAKLGSIVANEIVLFELQELLRERFPPGGDARLLDLGAGTKPYAPVYATRFAASVAVDVPSSPHDLSGVDVLASADSLPFPDESFDCVVFTEVLEHCADPAAVLAEVRRVLRPGGRVFLSTPFLVALHEMPHDYYRFTPSALRHLAAEAGLAVVSIRPKGDYVAVALGTLSFPWSKLWQVISSRLGMPLYHPRNPLVWVTIVLPQLAYVAVWKQLRRGRLCILRRLSDRLSYVTLGYVTVLAKEPGT